MARENWFLKFPGLMVALSGNLKPVPQHRVLKAEAGNRIKNPDLSLKGKARGKIKMENPCLINAVLFAKHVMINVRMTMIV